MDSYESLFMLLSRAEKCFHRKNRNGAVVRLGRQHGNGQFFSFVQAEHDGKPRGYLPKSSSCPFQIWPRFPISIIAKRVKSTMAQGYMLFNVVIGEGRQQLCV